MPKKVSSGKHTVASKVAAEMRATNVKKVHNPGRNLGSYLHKRKGK
jgi:hypothetical protein